VRNFFRKVGRGFVDALGEGAKLGLIIVIAIGVVGLVAAAFGMAFPNTVAAGVASAASL
jgi:hypothetical protein